MSAAPSELRACLGYGLLGSAGQRSDKVAKSSAAKRRLISSPPGKRVQMTMIIASKLRTSGSTLSTNRNSMRRSRIRSDDRHDINLPALVSLLSKYR
jgi:hypothetical protein